MWLSILKILFVGGFEDIPSDFMAGKTNPELKALWKENGLKDE